MSRRALKSSRPVAAARRFPAWIEGDAPLGDLVSGVEMRVRDSLVLRLVSKGRPARERRQADVRRAS